ncbi:MAG TPA: acetyl-CoA carboxylase, carboxyltransferase subunit beta [Armatimonadota bacterium]|nr:acetyl-CoA carboxylase, carboxyltransferase subunit beta [Armatimonadota bacterium]HOP80879.1 acetyl-CoA carboxylase, carboxyltransferase subunit beta [Armatimonadota bacterium]HPP73918.1 acetyl-CoA carboxylase, carboxyltransferase subunit beta [Armatimonadota bacterium]
MANTGWFGRKSKNARKIARQTVDALPDGLWTKCPKCNEILFNKELEKNLRVCGKCNYHFKLSAYDRLVFTVDDGSFEEFATELRTANPLNFPKYEAKLAEYREKSGLDESMVVGRAKLAEIPIVIGVAEFGFLGASMGSVYGEKVTRAMETAVAEKKPLIMFCSSGGARMHEGILSLMQMAKTSAAVARMNQAGLPYICVLTDPTTAGVHASFASLGDVIIAEPGALIGFAGARVATQAGLINRPPNFQTSEFQLEHGMIDMIVPRREMKSTLTKLLQFGYREAANVI